MRIGITFNLKTDIPASSAPHVPEDIAEELDSPETIDAIQNALSQGGHEVFLLGGDLSVLEKIKRFQIEFVFNIAEGFRGRNREAHIPALLELIGIPYSGSDPLGLATTLDKALAKRIAASCGVLTPEFCVLEDRTDLDQVPPRFPLFVKPLWQGSSMGIRLSSRVEDRAQLEREVGRIFKDYPGEPILVEEYIRGREITVGVFGNNPAVILGIMEIKFRDPQRKDFCYSLEVKRNWKEQVAYLVPAPLHSEQEKALQAQVLKLFNTLRLRDMARFDFRLDSKEKFYFLEVNPLPGLSPVSGDIVILAQKKGLSYQDLILKIARSAFDRYPVFNRSRSER
ncbi:MAG: ATP-grasp domain-containing protein [Candidatus Omnitrophica bacterium]|nr:ATP-grasp domain-containing protein [Candidatus Omnitrophota bacterium]